ncbi:MAG: TetR/AcrR family transcriptional regulator [Actinomycetota bacterium]|nr:TetR/AcrR family transcriptional regulator [Actinomycetota bacterium]
MASTIALFHRYGYSGTGLKQIVDNANAPFGSIYHFFPGGKQELGEEVLRQSGEMYVQIVEAVVRDAPDVITGVKNAFIGAAEVLRLTDYVDACPIATVALEVASSNERLRVVTSEVFESWIARATTWFADAGIPKGKSRQLAIVLIELLEGGFLLSRASRDTEALEAAGVAAVALIRAALPARGPMVRGQTSKRSPAS